MQFQGLRRSVGELLEPENARSAARQITIGCVFFLALAVGGAHPTVNALAVLVLAFTTGGVLTLVPNRASLGPPFYLALVSALATLLQLTPLPRRWLGVLSPATTTVHETAVDTPGAFFTVSLDIPATQHELIKMCILVLGAVLGATLFARRTKLLMGGIALAGVAVFAAGLLHALLGWRTPYNGFEHEAFFATSFINPNHAAGFLGFSSLLAAGLSADRRMSARVGWSGVAILCAAGMIVTLSRGAVLAFGATTVLWLSWFAVRGRFSGKTVLLVQVGTALALVIASSLAYSNIVHELWTLGDSTAISKAEIWQAIPSLLSDFWRFGVGRGALGMRYPVHQTIDSLTTFTHLENEWLQPLVDWGLPVGGLVLVLAIWSGVVIVRRLDHSPARIGGAAALSFLAIHNLVDFNLALTGISLPAILVASVLVSRPHRSRQRADSPGSTWGFTRLSSQTLLIGVLGISLFAALNAPGAIRNALTRETHRIQQASRNDYEIDFESAIERHPSDYFLPLLAALNTLSKRGGEREVLRWLNRSMQRAPQQPLPHRVAARALWSLGAHKQAMLELRLADEKGTPTDRAAKDALSLSQDLRLLAGFVGESADRRLVLASALLARDEGQKALTLVSHKSTKNRPEYQKILARVAERRRDFHTVINAARALRTLDPAQRAAYQLEAKAWLHLGSPARAIEALEAGLERSGPSNEILSLMVNARIRAKHYPQAREVAQRLLSRTSTPQTAASAHALLANVYLAEGLTRRGIREFEKARDRTPQNQGLTLRIAQLREQVGDKGAALSELRRLQAIAPDHAEASRMRARIETELRRERSEEAVREQEEQIRSLLGSPGER